MPRPDPARAGLPPDPVPDRSSSPRGRRPILGVVLIVGSALGVEGSGGCGPAEPIGPEPAAQARSPADQAATRALQVEVSQVVDEMARIYQPLVYQYDEDLLTTMSRVVRRLDHPPGAEPAAPAPGTATATAPPRVMGHLDQGEEDDHFRATIARWEKQTGGDFRRSLGELTQAAAELDRSQSFHPEFHAQFARVFDSFIALEVAEIRERRNRAIHRAVQPKLDAQRANAPDAVAQLEATLNQPPYALPPS